MVSSFPVGRKFVCSPLRQAARDTGRLGRLPNQNVSAFRPWLPPQLRCRTNAAAAPHTSALHHELVAVLGLLLRRVSWQRLARPEICRRQAGIGAGAEGGTMDPIATTAVAIAVVLIAFRRLRPRLPLDLEPHGARRVRPQGDHLLAGGRHPDPGLDPDRRPPHRQHRHHQHHQRAEAHAASRVGRRRRCRAELSTNDRESAHGRRARGHPGARLRPVHRRPLLRRAAGRARRRGDPHREAARAARTATRRPSPRPARARCSCR